MIKTVLIIEDDLVTMFLNRHLLEQDHFCENIIEATSGDEALSIFEKIKKGDLPPDHLPEIILLDLNMPVMDGWEFFENFINQFPEFVTKTKIFILSSSTDPKDQERAINDPNIAAYLSKPLDADEHFTIIKTFIG
ncbi:MAG: response regulator [Flavobacterium sp. BFFFF2]|nr:MAG: response regulator [Flavobacterium sp. BFFFF2]